MAYHNGQWESDRETRRRNEQMWNEAKGKGKKHGTGHGATMAPAHSAHREDDITRAMRDDYRGSTFTQVGGNTGTIGSALGHKIDRPIIPGGCKHDACKLFTTLSNGKALYPAMAREIVNVAHLDLIVDCAGLLQGKRFIKSSTAPKYRSLNLAAWPDVITLAWPDMTAPNQVGVKFWQRLIAAMPDHTAVCCMGGHGRTGTALASMLVADGMGADDAIALVRSKHCARAIETKEQEAYIRGLETERDKRIATGGRGAR